MEGGRIPGGTEPEFHQTPPGSSPMAASTALNKTPAIASN